MVIDRRIPDTFFEESGALGLRCSIPKPVTLQVRPRVGFGSNDYPDYYLAVTGKGIQRIVSLSLTPNSAVLPRPSSQRPLTFMSASVKILTQNSLCYTFLTP